MTRPGETPAAAAISRTVTAAAPRSANSRIAVSRMTAAARRSSFAIRMFSILNNCFTYVHAVSCLAVTGRRPERGLAPSSPRRACNLADDKYCNLQCLVNGTSVRGGSEEGRYRRLTDLAGLAVVPLEWLRSRPVLLGA